jgi:hypothetical protein
METVTTSRLAESVEPELYVLGAGVSFPEHLSIETIEILGRCNTICTNLPEEHLSLLPPDLRAKCTSLWGMYKEGRCRDENYRDIVEEIFRTAESKRPLAWLTPGHPLIFDSVSASLLTLGRAKGWSVYLAPAISCLDTILGEVEYDPAHGLFVQEATVLFRRKIPIPPNTSVLLLQPTVFNTDYAVLSLQAGGPDLSPLRDYLLGFYEPGNRCAFVRSGSQFTGPAKILWCNISELATVRFRDVAGATLFIPNPSPP